MLTKRWWKAAAIRALRTFAQAAIAVIPTSAILTEVNWWMVVSTAAVAAILSLLTSIATGLPEVPEVEVVDEAGEDGTAE